LKKEKRGRESKILKVLKLSGKGIGTGQNPEMVKGGHSSFLFPYLMLNKN